MKTPSRIFKGTKMAKVADLIRDRAKEHPDRRVEITGEEIARHTGLPKSLVHDIVWMLERKGFVRKVRPGARYRPMILQLVEPHEPEQPHQAAAEFATVHCPNCGYPIDVVQAFEDRIRAIDEARKKMVDALKTVSETGLNSAKDRAEPNSAPDQRDDASNSPRSL